MKRRSFLPLLLALILMGCGNSRQKIKYEKDSVRLKQDFLPGVSGPLNKKTLGDSLIGVWTDGSDVNASFLVKGDTIVFIEQPYHRYQIKNDSIKIFYDDHIYNAKIFFKNDTLIMDEGGEEGPIKYWRFKD